MFTANKIGVTVVIPSFGRHSLLEKQIKFLQHYEVRLVIVDGSPSEFLSLEAITGENRDRVKYIHLPGEDNFIERVIKGLDEVSTDFFCLMDDSDIVLPEALSCISDWLRQNPEFSASGQVYRIISENREIAIQRWGHWSNELLLEDDSRTKNFSQAIRDVRTGNLVYVVCPIRLRTEIISQLNALLLKHKKYSFRLFEHVFASTILANSKFRKLPIPFWFRCETNEEEISLKKTTVNLPLRTREYETWRDFAFSSIFQNVKSSSQMRHEIADSILCLESKVQAMHVDARGIVESRKALVIFLKKFVRKIPFIRSLMDYYHQGNRLTQIEIEKSKKSDLEDLLKNREQNQKRMIISQLYHGLGIWFLKTNLYVRNPNSS